MGGYHAEQPARPLGERRRLDGAKTRSGRDVPVRREARVGVDIDDDGLGALPGGPPARLAVVIDHGEVVEELKPETVLGRDPQRSGLRIENLDIAPVGAGQVHRLRPG